MTWKQGRVLTSVVSDEPTADQVGGADDTAYYGGFLVGESVPPSLVPLIAAAPEMLAALERALVRLESDGISRDYGLERDISAAITKAGGAT